MREEYHVANDSQCRRDALFQFLENYISTLEVIAYAVIYVLCRVSVVHVLKNLLNWLTILYLFFCFFYSITMYTCIYMHIHIASVH